jgi:hypothetical protein
MNEFERGGVMAELSEARAAAREMGERLARPAFTRMAHLEQVKLADEAARVIRALIAASAPVEGDEREALARQIDPEAWRDTHPVSDAFVDDAEAQQTYERFFWQAVAERRTPSLEAADRALVWMNARRPSTPTDKEILRERSRQIEKGYDTAHDDEHGLDHLLFWAQRYGMEGKHLESLALVQAAREYLPRHQASTPTEEDVERVGDAIERVGGWKHLRRYSGMTPEWMDRLRSGIVRAALSAVHPEVTQ